MGALHIFKVILLLFLLTFLFLEHEGMGYSSSSLNVVLKYGPLFIFQGERGYVARNTISDNNLSWVVR